ncbi:alpha/beta fold hydrolase [Bermanella sp. R86510]|uniref:alpha/beta fold hydrolase n=1 Tax=unclassified Bermanella TaxID=2627862 RepID=UPI0037C77AE4
MKSSSQLFPVSLMRADVIDDTYIEDTYLLKPNNSPDPTVQVAVTRIGKYHQQGQGGIPIVLLHGAFNNHGCWQRPDGKGVAAALLEAGFDPWLVDLRGHGQSPVNHQYKFNNQELYAKYDLPALQAFIYEKNPTPAFWCGHSWGGVLVATAIAMDALDMTKLAGSILMGSQTRRYPLALRLPFVRTFSKLYVAFKPQFINLKIGPEAEPQGIAKEFVRWASIFRGWRTSTGQSLKQAWKVMDVPLLVVAAPNDKSDPAKHCKRLYTLAEKSPKRDYVLLSKANGYSKNYGHLGMIASSQAVNDVWPNIISWMQSVMGTSNSNK